MICGLHISNSLLQSQHIHYSVYKTRQVLERFQNYGTGLFLSIQFKRICGGILPGNPKPFWMAFNATKDLGTKQTPNNMSTNSLDHSLKGCSYILLFGATSSIYLCCHKASCSDTCFFLFVWRQNFKDTLNKNVSEIIFRVV